MKVYMLDKPLDPTKEERAVMAWMRAKKMAPWWGDVEILATYAAHARRKTAAKIVRGIREAEEGARANDEPLSALDCIDVARKYGKTP